MGAAEKLEEVTLETADPAVVVDLAQYMEWKVVLTGRGRDARCMSKVDESEESCMNWCDSEF